MKKIEMGKKYKTKNGHDVEILKIGANLLEGRSVIVLIKRPYQEDDVMIYFSDGKCFNNVDCGDDLIAVTPYDDFKIDDKVLVWDSLNYDNKKKRHFAGVDKDGKPMTFPIGTTSFTYDNEPLITWDFCEKWEEKC